MPAVLHLWRTRPRPRLGGAVYRSDSITVLSAAKYWLKVESFLVTRLLVGDIVLYLCAHVPFPEVLMESSLFLGELVCWCC